MWTGYPKPSNSATRTVYGLLEDIALHLDLGLDVLGEPKYYVSGEVYDKPWGRPQTDSPALRAITLIAWAEDLIKTNGTDYVLEQLWVPDTAKHSAIKWDLEFIAFTR